MLFSNKKTRFNDALSKMNEFEWIVQLNQFVCEQVTSLMLELAYLGRVKVICEDIFK